MSRLERHLCVRKGPQTRNTVRVEKERTLAQVKIQVSYKQEVSRIWKVQDCTKDECPRQQEG